MLNILVPLACIICATVSIAVKSTFNEGNYCAQPEAINIRDIGNTNTYCYLKQFAPYNDGNEIHHMPCQHLLKRLNLDTENAFSIVLTKSLHKKTRTYTKGERQYNNYETAILQDVKEVIQILRQAGYSYTSTRDVMVKFRQWIIDNKHLMPHLYNHIVRYCDNGKCSNIKQ